MGKKLIQYVKTFFAWGGLGNPIDYNWEVVEIFVKFFRLFYKVTTNFFGLFIRYILWLLLTNVTWKNNLIKWAGVRKMCCGIWHWVWRLSMTSIGEICKMKIFSYIWLLVSTPSKKFMAMHMAWDWHMGRHGWIILCRWLVKHLVACLMSLPQLEVVIFQHIRLQQSLLLSQDGKIASIRVGWEARARSQGPPSFRGPIRVG